jgi:hypothetical protein
MKSLLHIGTLAWLATVLSLTTAETSLAGEHRILHIDDLQRGELICRGFEIKKSLDIDIHAIGSGWNASRQLAGYAWIIRSGSLEPVWVMDQHNTDEISEQPRLREYESSIELEPGEYEVYFYAGSPFGPGKVNIQLDGLGDLYGFMVEMLSEDLVDELREIGEQLETEMQELEKELEKDLADVQEDLRDRQDEYLDAQEEYLETLQDWKLEEKKRRTLADKLVREYFLDLSTDTDAFERARCAFASESVVAEILEPGHQLYSSVGFSCLSPLEVEVTALGEYSEFDQAFVDHGWLVNAATRERIWAMDRDNTNYVGGDTKNRGVHTFLELDSGDYLLYYVTDDSHAYNDFNAAPPYNPQAYGIRVTVQDPADLKQIKPYRDTFSESALIAITQVGDDACLRRSFQITKPCNFRIYAIGEYGASCGDLCDYAWIEKAGLPKSFWEMTKENTHHAGGATKNRLFDDVVHFEKGVYTLGYVTDGSHSYGSFNAAAPFDQTNYGVSLYTLPDGCKPSQVRELARPDEGLAVLAKITCVGNSAELVESFELAQPTKVRVYALGEGMGASMYDYGWVQRSDNGQIVWEMTYRKTRAAGGAEKNRLVDDIILLDSGEYEVWYISDDSHSFSAWNAQKPRDPQGWGITVLKLEE